MYNLKVEKNIVFEELLRTIAWETLSQMALRNCSKEVRETVSIYVILVRGVHVIRLAFQQKVAASHEEKKSS